MCNRNGRILLAKSLQGEKSGSYLGFWLRWTGPEPFFYPNWRYDASRFSRTGSAPSNSPAVSDKFCLTRAGRLRLAWSRVQVRGRGPDGAYPRSQVTHRGGGHAAAALWARPAHRRDGADRSAALGPGLSAPPAVGDDGPGRAGGIAGGGQPAGDVPCA